VRGARVVRDGAVVTVRKPAARSSIPPGRTATLAFTAKGTGAQPSTCAFNGDAC
jgi:hypothetical protein